MPIKIDRERPVKPHRSVGCCNRHPELWDALTESLTATNPDFDRYRVNTACDIFDYVMMRAEAEDLPVENDWCVIVADDLIHIGVYLHEYDATQDICAVWWDAPTRRHQWGS